MHYVDQFTPVLVIYHHIMTQRKKKAYYDITGNGQLFQVSISHRATLHNIPLVHNILVLDANLDTNITLTCTVLTPITPKRCVFFFNKNKIILKKLIFHLKTP